MSDLFGARVRGWLAEQLLPADQRETVEACLCQIDFFDDEITSLDRALAEAVLGSIEMRCLLTLPGA